MDTEKSYSNTGFLKITVLAHTRILEGQKHRCSSNYCFDLLKRGQKIRWTMPAGISFTIKRDEWMTDPVLFATVKNGSETTLETGDFYFADPRATSGLHFHNTVKVSMEII